MDVSGVAFLPIVFLATALSVAMPLGRHGPRPAARRRQGPDGPVGLLARRVSDRVRGMAVVRRAAESRELERTRRGCLGEMPEFLDIVTLGLSAGLSFDASVELYCSRYVTTTSKVFLESMRSWQIGLTSRAEALEELSVRLGSSALRSFSSAVSEALAFGTPLVGVLARQADAIRAEQRSQVEEQIEKAPVKMLVPLGTLIVPALLLAILGPLLSSALRVG